MLNYLQRRPFCNFNNFRPKYSCLFINRFLWYSHNISNGMELLQWGANRRFETTSGEWWRLLTSMFCTWHYAFISKHFRTCNCSHFVEPLLGRKNYFILYIWTLWKPCKLVVSKFNKCRRIRCNFRALWCNTGLLLTNAFRRRKKEY
jgi:hypothetical protein